MSLKSIILFNVVKRGVLRRVKGGAGSGNFGHAGRPGKVGGSAPRTGGNMPKANPDEYLSERAKRVTKTNYAEYYREFFDSGILFQEIPESKPPETVETGVELVRAFVDLQEKCPVLFSKSDPIKLFFTETTLGEFKNRGIFLIDQPYTMDEIYLPFNIISVYKRTIEDKIRTMEDELGSERKAEETLVNLQEKYERDYGVKNPDYEKTLQECIERQRKLEETIVHAKRYAFSRNLDTSPDFDHSAELFPRRRMAEVIVRHELGHRLEKRIVFALFQYLDHPLKNSFRRLKEDYFAGRVKKVTARGDDSFEEYFAENFVLWSIGKYNMCAPEFNGLMDIVNQYRTMFKGGAGSGNFGHAGRPGKVGGSAPSSERASQPKMTDWAKNKQERINELYALGEKIRSAGHTHLTDNAYYEFEKELRDVISRLDTTVVLLGLRGKPKPYYVRGWRRGHVPERGFSYNYRDNTPENGVSVMEVYDYTADYKPDLYSAAVYGQRDAVEVEGFLNTGETGSDGEPLLLYAREIP